MLEKITQFLNITKFHLDGNVGVMTLIILIALAGFGLGRLSSSESVGDTDVIILQQASATDSSTTFVNGGLLVGSRNGNKYHYPWCPGAGQMKEGNKVWFESVEEATRAGYSAAANCRGL